MGGQVEKTAKKSKVMEKLKRSGSGKSSQKKATSIKAKLNYTSLAQEKLVISTTGHVMGVEAELMEQKMKVVSRSPAAKPPSGGHEDSHNDDSY